MDSLQTLLSPRTLAERWDCSRSTIYDMVSKKALPSIKVGGMLRIPLKAVEEKEAWLDEQEDIGSSPEKAVESTRSVGLRTVGNGPEALAAEIKRRRNNF